MKKTLVLALAVGLLAGCGTSTLSPEEYRDEATRAATHTGDAMQDAAEGIFLGTSEEADTAIAAMSAEAGSIRYSLEQHAPPEEYEDTHADLVQALILLEESGEVFLDGQEELSSELLWESGALLYDVLVDLDLDT